MRKLHLVLAGIPAALLASTLLSHDDGTIPGQKGVLSDATRAAPSCSSCHSGNPQGANNLQVSLSPTARSLDTGQGIQVTVSATGGAAGIAGGFAAENTGGAFSAGGNTWIDTTGAFVTHKDSRQSNNRTWDFGYTAPNQPGPVELYTVVLTANGNGGKSGDIFGFHGFDAANPVSTPVRLYANATGVSSFGAGCVGSFGNYPVLGARQSPAVGNSSFAFEVVSAPPLAPVTVLVGVPQPSPINLGVIGVTGCDLYIRSIGDVSGATGPGNAQRAEGTASILLPIPNDARLRGIRVAAQAVLIDALNGRRVPVTLTNALSITVQ